MGRDADGGGGQTDRVREDVRRVVCWEVMVRTRGMLGQTHRTTGLPATRHAVGACQTHLPGSRVQLISEHQLGLVQAERADLVLSVPWLSARYSLRPARGSSMHFDGDLPVVGIECCKEQTR